MMLEADNTTAGQVTAAKRPDKTSFKGKYCHSLYAFCKVPGFTMEIPIQKIHPIFMSICTQNRFDLLHCDWLDVIPIFYHVIIKIQDP